MHCYVLIPQLSIAPVNSVYTTHCIALLRVEYFTDIATALSLYFIVTVSESQIVIKPAIIYIPVFLPEAAQLWPLGHSLPLHCLPYLCDFFLRWRVGVQPRPRDGVTWWPLQSFVRMTHHGVKHVILFV
jgi:hypothetical protein